MTRCGAVCLRDFLVSKLGLALLPEDWLTCETDVRIDGMKVSMCCLEARDMPDGDKLPMENLSSRHAST